MFFYLVKKFVRLIFWLIRFIIVEEFVEFFFELKIMYVFRRIVVRFVICILVGDLVFLSSLIKNGRWVGCLKRVVIVGGYLVIYVISNFRNIGCS